MGQIQGYGYSTIAIGNSEWLQNVASPLAREVESLVPYRSQAIPIPMVPTSGVRNDLIGVAAVGVFFFVAKHLSEKFLDDVYAQFQPRVRRFLAAVDVKLSGANARAKKVLYVNAWYHEYDVLVVVSVTGKDFLEIEKQLHLVSSVHSNARSWIVENGARRPVHYYRIEDGKVNAAPVLLSHFEEALESGARCQI